ncbi:MAG: replicative DNA helicase [Halanaerobium sp. 4-GBenrich]|jgi:replicative DNA helicase|uniref:DNA 5'-3' helicase n=1 Tax=Halanaerobium congolense TaxID=54121 RepID=A0A1G6IP47_9FIRM|nr:DnaB-like helicase C-terminal domain-containing protein [Halanaerobium congolense]KXS50354.1 MAG: replicative DNA helicase [Halanaerobium sp. T82-1]ODS50678.1 MAG: replicative DNA helicase [Halanaerobium sp. 4-GBenrich]PUU92387.1 MAG: replicative DNA helicase [Halanaerobium sp.]PXV64505.1 replicative DNA helicase [Halanaerobium congolense]TDP17985.1 replicative DNA helicase [Halanaerobium congolense]
MSAELNNVKKDDRYNKNEYQLLGILLQYPDKIDEVADLLEVKHFLDPQAQIIFDLLLKQYQQDNQISRTKLLIDLQNQNYVDQAEEIIERLTSGFNTIDELDPTIDLIKKDYQRSLLQRASNKLQELTQANNLTIDDYQARAQEIIFQATNESSDLEKHIYNMEEVLMESFSNYMDRKHKKADVGLRSGFISLDNLIGGFKRGHLNVIAASTSMGKTAFAINIAKNVLKRKAKVAMISLEMDAAEVVDRMVIQESQVNAWKYTQGETNDEEDQRISKALDNLHELPLMISDERGLNTAQIRARLRKFKAQMDGLDLAIVDYLQMIQLPEEHAQNTSRAVGQIVLQLRNLASELNIPVILISQISRSFTSRTDKRPVLSDLRDSGNIEEVADGVIFLYRHAHTSAKAREEAEAEGTESDTNIIIAKQRTGQTGSITLFFEEEFIRFVDPENLSLEGTIPHG